MSSDFDIVNDRFTRGIIRRKATQLVKRPGFPEQDIESLEQTLLAQVIQAMPTFNPDIAHRNVFITTVVERYVSTLVRKRTALKHGPGHVQSLNVSVIVPDDQPTQLQYTLAESVGDARQQVDRKSSRDLSDLASDIATIISSLPEPWQRMLELRKSHSLSEISEMMQVPRSTLRYWMFQVAEKFDAAGLREYLA